ncbi:MAG: hypothetical protein CL881_05570 [Dehalococcoidia bacterium]|nr:hypothetical protein [Dehalococcoidia bacterium]
MYVFLFALLLYVVVAIVSILITYYVCVIFNKQSKAPEPALNAVISTNIVMLFNNVGDFVADTLSIITSKLFVLTDDIISKATTVSRVAVLIGMIVVLHTQTDKFLDASDGIWRCFIQPFFQNVLMSIFQIFRLWFDAAIPLYNYYSTMLGQLTSGSVALAIKCDLSSTVKSISMVVQIFLSIFTSILSWSGSGQMSVENNLIVNEFNVTSVVVNIQKLVAHQQSPLTCACDGLKDFFDIFFVFFRNYEIARAANHFFNIFVSFAQTLMGTIPPFIKFPTFTKTMYHINGFIHETAKYVDVVTYDVVLKVISLFADDFSMQGAPETFFAVALTRFPIGIVHLIHSLIRTVLHIIIPVPYYITNVDYMFEAVSIDKAVSYFDMGIRDICDLGYWLGEMFGNILLNILLIPSSVVKQKTLPGLPSAVKLDCTGNPQALQLSKNVACSVMMVGLLPLNTVHLIYKLFMELTFKSLISGEQDAWRTWQRYDGLSYPRDSSIDCYYRADATWDLTNGECLCDRDSLFPPLEITHSKPFGVMHYDPYCGQPNLQANIFGVVERAVSYIMNVGIGINAAYFVEVNAKLYIEVFRVLIKVILNSPDIFTGKYFRYPVNCGYGVSESRLEEWWEDTGHELNTTFCGDHPGYMHIDVNKDPVFSLSENGFGHFTNEVKSSTEPCGTADSAPPYDKCYKCYPIHETIRYYKCMAKKNSHGMKFWADNKEQTIELDTCKGNNTQGCVCNVGLELDHDNQCSCIFKYPDVVQEVAQGAFENKMLEGLYDHPHHWCNSYFLEYIFYYLEQYAGIIDNFVGGFHPAYSEESGYCQSSSFELQKTDILRLTEDEFNEDLSIYEVLGFSYTSRSCKIYGSIDFLCSISMTVKTGLKLIINQVRIVLMTMIDFINGDFSGFKLDVSERLCDLQRTAAGLSSTFAAIIPTNYVPVKKGLGMLLFSLFDFPVVVLDMINQLLVFLSDVIQGKAGFDKSVEGPIFNLVFTLINTFLNWMSRLLEGMEVFFNNIHKNAGNFFGTLNGILKLFQELLSQAIMDTIVLIIKVFSGIIKVVTGKGIDDTFFSDLWNLLGKMITMLLTNAGKVLEAILKMLGPIGEFIKTFADTICNTIEDVICALTFGKTCNLKCGDGQPASFAAEAEAAGEAIEDFFGGLFGRRRLLSVHGKFSSEFDKTPLYTATHMEWNGSSACDMFVNSYANYTWTQMRPIERIQLIECLNDRKIAMDLSKALGVTLPVDIIYNWKRKYTMGYHMFLSMTYYVQHLMGHMTVMEFITKLKTEGVDTDKWIPIVQNMKERIYSSFTFSSVNSFVFNVFHSIDPEIHKSNKSLGSMYRIYKTGAQFIDKTKLHRAQLGAQLKQTAKVFNYDIPYPKVPSKVMYAYHNWHNYTSRFEARPAKTIGERNARNFILRAAGLSSDTTPCSEREDAHVCLNCNLLDNFINTAINNGLKTSDYYKNVYAPVVVPSFINYFDESAREFGAWSVDAANALDKAAQRAGEDIDQFTDAQIKALDKNYKLKSTRHYNNATNSSTIKLTNFQRADKDWTYLIENFALRNDVEIIDILSDFLTVADDTYIPYVGYSLGYYLTYPLTEACPIEVIYCEQNTTKQRLNLITDAFKYMLYTMLGIFIISRYTTLPIFESSVPYFPIIMLGIYMFTVYNYTYFCFPNIPNCVVDDMFAYINDVMFPNCFCTYYDGLAKACDPETCFLCSKKTPFETCTQIDLLNQLTYFWTPLFWFRVNHPDVFLWIYRTIPFSWFLRRYDPVVKLATDIIEGTEPTPIELDCLGLHYPDFVLLGLVAFTCSYILSAVVPIMIRSIQHYTKIFVLFILTVFNMSVSIELQTIGGLDNEVD